MSVDNGDNSPEQVYDVLIVGAGPVGLAIALGLRENGINNILVIDQTRHFRRVGQVLDLFPNGLKALQSIAPQAYQEIKKVSLERQSLNTQNGNQTQQNPKKTQWHHKNLHGEIIRSVPLEFDTWFNRYGGGRISMPWYDLQTTLRNLLPSEIVQNNYRCFHFEEETSCLKIDCISDGIIDSNPFAHWEIQPSPLDTFASSQEASYHKQFRAKVVVAADGINSTIRQVLYAETDLSDWANPQYSRFSAIGCLHIENVPNSLVEELEKRYFQGELVLSLHPDSIKVNYQQPRIILIHHLGNTLGYIIHTPLSLESFENKSAEEIISLGIEVLEKAKFPPIFRELLSLSSPENLFYRPYYIQPATIPIDSHPIWSRGRVVLVGDAAHGMPPFIAQGANQGFEDAAVISTLITTIIKENCLDDETAIAQAFDKYEQIRRPFMVTIQEATMTSHQWSQQQWDDYNNLVYSRNFPSDSFPNF